MLYKQGGKQYGEQRFMEMTQALSEYASASGESINILSVAVYRNQALYSSNNGIVHVNTCATLPCSINRYKIYQTYYNTAKILLTRLRETI